MFAGRGGAKSIVTPLTIVPFRKRLHDSFRAHKKIGLYSVEYSTA